MAKINEEAFDNAKSTAGLKSTNEQTEDVEVQRYIAVYDVPKIWIKTVKTKTGIKNMSAFARQAILEKLERDGLL
jgi:hypothetical protein